MTIIVCDMKVLVADRLVTHAVNREANKIETGRCGGLEYHVAMAGYCADINHNMRLIHNNFKDLITNGYVHGLKFTGNDYDYSADSVGLIVIHDRQANATNAFILYGNGFIEDVTEQGYIAVGVERAQAYCKGFLDGECNSLLGNENTLPAAVRAVLAAQNNVSDIGKGCTYVKIREGTMSTVD